MTGAGRSEPTVIHECPRAGPIAGRTLGTFDSGLQTRTCVWWTIDNRVMSIVFLVPLHASMKETPMVASRFDPFISWGRVRVPPAKLPPNSCSDRFAWEPSEAPKNGLKPPSSPHRRDTCQMHRGHTLAVGMQICFGHKRLVFCHP